MAIESSTTFGALLHHFRVTAGLTQEALAERAQLSVRAISDLKWGQRRSLYSHTIHQLARAGEEAPP
jgi:transcriptional regulator with XRE-family HTH domain